MSFSKQIVLFIVPDEQLRSTLTDTLQQYENPYPYKVVANKQDIQSVLENEMVCCIVMPKAVALAGEDGKEGLIATQSGLPPTITLLRHGDGYPDYLYRPNEFHDSCTIPFGLDELYDRLKRLLERASQHQ